LTADEYIQLKHLADTNYIDVADELCFDDNIEQIDKVIISFELFERKPSYGILMYTKHLYSDLSKENKELHWSMYMKNLASGSPEHKKHIKYSLWVDFFEDQSTVDDAWSNLVHDKTELEVLRQILSISGPVPFNKKYKLYLKTIANFENHEFIFESLLGSFFDVYGQIDVIKTRDVLSKLTVNRSTKKYLLLSDHLERFDSKEEYWDYIKNRKDNS